MVFSFLFTVENLLEIITTKVNIMMEHYDELKGTDDEELLETDHQVVSKRQQLSIFIPSNFDFN